MLPAQGARPARHAALMAKLLMSTTQFRILACPTGAASNRSAQSAMIYIHYSFPLSPSVAGQWKPENMNVAQVFPSLCQAVKANAARGVARLLDLGELSTNVIQEALPVPSRTGQVRHPSVSSFWDNYTLWNICGTLGVGPPKGEASCG